MKNYKLYIYLLLCPLLFLACEDEDTIRIPESFQKGANVRIQFTEGKTFLNFLDLAGSEIEYTVYTEQTDELAQVDIFLVFDPASGPAQDTILFESFTPASFTNGQLTRSYTSDELAKIVGLAGLEDLEGGDIFNFNTVATLSDGRVYPSPTVKGNTNVSPTISQAATTSFTETFFSFVGCPTEIVPGTYIAKPTNGIAAPCSNDPFGSDTIVEEAEVTISQIGVVFFDISDVSLEYYVLFGFEPQQPVQILDVCNTLSLAGTTGAQFNLTVSGTHDPETNTIDLQWIDLGNANITCENTFTLKE